MVRGVKGTLQIILEQMPILDSEPLLTVLAESPQGMRRA